jgi:hypothetical protein
MEEEDIDVVLPHGSKSIVETIDKFLCRAQFAVGSGAGLGGEDQFVAVAALYGPPDDVFRFVGGSAVEDINAEIEGALNEGNGFGLRFAALQAKAGIAAATEAGDASL